MHADMEGTTSTPIMENLVRTLMATTHVQKNNKELDVQLAQLILQQETQEQVVGRIHADHQFLASQIHTFATEVQAKAQAAVLQWGSQVSETQVAFADRHMQVLAQIQAQCHKAAAQMQHLMASMSAHVPRSGTASVHVSFLEASSHGPAGLVSEGGVIDGHKARLGQTSAMKTSSSNG